MVDDRLLEVYRRARNPDDPIELRNLFVSRIEFELGPRARRPNLAELWTSRSPFREVQEETVLCSRGTPRFVKELFNWFFRDDLYGELRSEHHIILSSGSVDETIYGLPPALKECINYALDRDWYGYSDSRGRSPAREAIGALENMRVQGEPYAAENVAITMGGTFAISALTDFILSNPRSRSPALCALPNYPPLVESVARRAPIRLVPLECRAGVTSLRPLIEALRPSTPMVLLQTVTNPTGTAVTDEELARLIRMASPETVVLLDECHESVGPRQLRCRERAEQNVVRVSSLSKTFSVPGLKIGWIVGDAGFISEFYEYASTTYGGPPSFFYTLVEVLARMERWLLLGLDTPGRNELGEFEESYGLTRRTLAAAYTSYRLHRNRRTEALENLRDGTYDYLRRMGFDTVRPRHSINVATRIDGYDDSYLAFRELLGATNIAPFPGILTYCFGGSWIRLTTARNQDRLAEALRRLAAFVREQPGNIQTETVIASLKAEESGRLGSAAFGAPRKTP